MSGSSNAHAQGCRGPATQRHPRSLNASRGGRLREVFPVAPCGGLFVEGAGVQASVQDADEPVREPCERAVQPNKTVLTPPGGHDIPAVISSTPATGRGTVLGQGSKPREESVLICRRPPSTESAGWPTR
jgi:hypothetical protein